MDAELVVVWVSASLEVCRKRMAQRSSDRDSEKLKNWDEYVKNIDFSAPTELLTTSAVDKLIVFDNENEQTARASFSNILNLLGE